MPIDVRVIAATNQDIGQLVQDGKFREDLYYRLNVVPIRIPVLRERRDDIPLLVDHFLHQFCQRHDRSQKRLAPNALRILQHYHWPGNIRQLRNCIERIVVTVEGDTVHEEELPEELREATVVRSNTLAFAVEQAEQEAIRGALAACDCHRERTAKMLDISVRTLHYKMSRYNLH
jgi:two-component system NtrC family response regulator